MDLAAQKNPLMTREADTDMRNPDDPHEPIAFRYAVAEDAGRLTALIERAYRGRDAAGLWSSEAHLLTGPRTSTEEVLALTLRADTRFLIAETKQGLLGCCLLQDLPERAGGHAAYFGMFAIDPGAHGTGIGKAVLAQAERCVQELWSAGQMVMTVISVRTELIAWYERRGYHLTGASLPFPFTATTGETTRDFCLLELRRDLTR